MKKFLLLITLVAFLPFTSCKKDKKETVDQLSFSLENLVSLLGKSPDYIKQASPGDYDEENSDATYLMFVYGGAAVLGDLYIGYGISSSKCDEIAALAESEELDAVDYLMSMAEDDFGDGDLYGLSYYDAGDNLVDEEFANYDDLWSFIDDYSLTPDDIDVVLAAYTSGETTIIVSGLWLYTYFWPSVVITNESLKSTASPVLSAKAMIERLHNSGMHK